MTRLSYNLKEAAEITGLTVRTLRDEIYVGHLEVSKPTKRGRKVLIPAKVLENYIDAGRIQVPQ